jgi:hypothetical protein
MKQMRRLSLAKLHELRRSGSPDARAITLVSPPPAMSATITTDDAPGAGATKATFLPSGDRSTCSTDGRAPNRVAGPFCAAAGAASASSDSPAMKLNRFVIIIPLLFKGLEQAFQEAQDAGSRNRCACVVALP